MTSFSTNDNQFRIDLQQFELFATPEFYRRLNLFQELETELEGSEALQMVLAFRSSLKEYLLDVETTPLIERSIIYKEYLWLIVLLKKHEMR